jgi:hypothetical protein
MMTKVSNLCRGIEYVRLTHFPQRDVVNLMREHFDGVHALSERPETIFDMTGPGRA